MEFLSPESLRQLTASLVVKTSDVTNTLRRPVKLADATALGIEALREASFVRVSTSTIKPAHTQLLHHRGQLGNYAAATSQAAEQQDPKPVPSLLVLFSPLYSCTPRAPCRSYSCRTFKPASGSLGLLWQGAANRPTWGLNECCVR